MCSLFPLQQHVLNPPACASQAKCFHLLLSLRTAALIKPDKLKKMCFITRSENKKSVNHQTDQFHCTVNELAPSLGWFSSFLRQLHLLMLSPGSVLFFSKPHITSALPAGYPGFQTTTYTSRSYAGITPGYTYQFPGNHSTLPVPRTMSHDLTDEHTATHDVFKALTQSFYSSWRTVM